MSKILVNDLKELAKQLPDTEVLSITNEFGEIIHEITIKQHLPITEKIGLVSSIYKSAIDKDDTLSIINRNALNIAYKVLVVKTYSNVNLPQDNVLAYDLLIKSRLFNQIYEAIPEEERIELEKVMDDYIKEKQERYERENALPNIVKNMLNGLVEKLPTVDEAHNFVEQASKELNNLDPDNFKFVQDFLKANRGE